MLVRSRITVFLLFPSPFSLKSTRDNQPLSVCLEACPVFSTPRLGSIVAEEWLGILFPLVSSNCLPPDICGPTDDSFSSTSGRGGRTDVEIEHGLAAGFGLARIVVNDVANLLLLTVDMPGDVPIVSVKRHLDTVSRHVSISAFTKQRHTRKKRKKERKEGRRVPTQTWRGISSPAPEASWPLASSPWACPGNE